MAASRDLVGKKDNLTIRPFLRKDLLRLYNAIIDNYKQDDHQNGIEQIKEFNELIGHYTNQDHVEASTFSSKLLLKLCHDKIISIDVLLKKFLTISAISKNIACSISSIFELIIMDIKEQIHTHGTYTCPYRIKSPPHPLITVFQQWQDSSEIIITEMKHCFERESKLERTTAHILTAMKPFLSFIFLDPKRASKSWIVVSFSAALIQLMKQMDEIGEGCIAVDIAKFLLKMISCRKVTGLLTCGNTSITEQLAHCLLELTYSNEMADVITKLGYTVMSQCHKLTQMNLNTSVHVNLMLKIFLKHPELFISEEFVYLLALLLYRIPSVGKEVALKLAIHVLPCYSSSCKSSTQLRIFKTFALPLMTILSNNLGLQEEENLQILAENIFLNVENYLVAMTDSVEIDKQDVKMSIHTPLELIIAKHNCSLLHEINRSESSALAFLKAIKESKSCSDSSLLVLSSLFVNPENSDILAEALKVLLELGKIDAKMGLQFLPLLLHTSSCSSNSMITFQILECLPSLAINKHLVSPVLKAVMLLSNCDQLLPLSIRLTTDLWKIQPRIFPYLLQLLSKNIKASEMCPDVWEEVAIGKATSIFEICKSRPVQHGPDVIGLLAKVFDDFEQGTFGTRLEVADTAVYLSLEALKSLCEAEVSDFQTAWAVVASKVMSRSSDLILKGIISLLSIVPLVLGTTADDMDLRKFACNFIWKHVTHQNFNISSAASVYLTNFSTGEFIVERLPEEIRLHAIDLLVRKHNLKKRQDDDNYNPEMESLNGPVYVYLLENLKSEAARGYSVLLSKVLKEEIEMLPRNMSSASTATKLISTYDKYIDSIPEFLKSFYEKNSNPALIQSIAAGVHSCYMSTLHLGRSGKIGRRHLIDDAKASRKMLDNLLSEIYIAHMDWQQSVTSPTSWSNFMRRVYDSTIEGRKAELSLQYDQGRFPDKEDLDIEVSNASYWARDELTHQLMRASRGNPTSQANSVLALAGLAVTIANGNGAMDDKNQSQQYSYTKNWLVKVADTVMVVLDGNFKAKGQPFQWCQQFSSHKSTASSLLSRSCAAVALSEIAAALIFVDVERIKQISSLLMSRIPGQEKSGTSAVIQFNAAIGLGMLLKRLKQERFNDVTGEDGILLTRKAFHVLHETIYNEDLQNREGALFGYGLALGSLCLEATKESRIHASKACSDLLEIVRSLKLEQRIKPMDEGYFFALGAAAINGFRAGAISIEFVVKSIDVIKEASKIHKQSSSLLTIYGFVLHGALSSGLSRVQDIVEENVDIWLKDAADIDKEFQERISSIHGLLSVFGAMSFLFPCDDLDVFSSSLKSKLTTAIKTVERVMETNGDAEFCMYSCRLLSLFYMSYHGESPRQIALPSNYNYLPETSLLRNLFTCLIDAGKSGPCGRLSEPAVNSILSSLICVAELKLPPANWPQVLNPLMKIGYDEECRRLCLKFAILIASSCPTIPTWLLSWMSPSVFLCLELSCRKEILSSISTVVAVVPLNKVKMIIEELMVKIFQNEDGCLEEQLLALESLKKLASITNPVQSSLVCIKCALIQICKDEALIKNQIVIKGIVEVLLCLPNELKCSVLDSLQTVDLVICMESAMVIFFQSPLKCMERTFHMASADPTNLTSFSIKSIKSALQYHFLNGPSPNEHDQRVFWFLDQLGRTKKFITNGMVDKSLIWLDILASAVNTWSTSLVTVATMDDEFNSLYNPASTHLFGLDLSHLLQNNSWKNLREKVLKWLIELAEICQSNLDEDIAVLSSLFKGAILQLNLSTVGATQENWMKSLDIVLSS